MTASLNRMKVVFISLLLSLWYEDEHIRENEKLYLYSLYKLRGRLKILSPAGLECSLGAPTATFVLENRP
jgi:hypothetical protein